MGAEIVHDHEIIGAQRRHQNLFDVGEEQLAVDRAVIHARRYQPVIAQAGNEGRCFPMPMRNGRDHALASCSAAKQSGHVGLDPGLVDEDQPPRLQPGLLLAPVSAGRGNVGAILLGRTERLFLNVSPSRASVLCIKPSLAETLCISSSHRRSSA